MSLPSVELRPLDREDLEVVLALNQHWVPHVGSLDAEHLGSLLAGADLALGAWVAPEGGSVAQRAGATDRSVDLVGFVIVMAAGADYASPNYRYFTHRHHTFTYVDRIAVAARAQGLGVGRRLYEAVVAHAGASGSTVVCAEVNLQPPNPGSQAFHAGFGFTEVGRQWTYGDTVEVQLLELTL